MSHVLVVENDPVISNALRTSLVESGWQCTIAASVKEARARFQELTLDLILLDLELNDGYSLELCREIHEKNSSLPIIIITASLDEETALKGLSYGAVDYIRKPFGRRELLLKVKKLVGPKARTFAFEGLTLNINDRTTAFEKTPISLSPTEITLLALLMENAGHAVSKERLLDRIDGEADLSEQTLKSYVSRLRKKLKESGADHIDVVSVYGHGYRLESKA